MEVTILVNPVFYLGNNRNSFFDKQKLKNHFFFQLKTILLFKSLKSI